LSIKRSKVFLVPMKKGGGKGLITGRKNSFSWVSSDAWDLSRDYKKPRGSLGEVFLGSRAAEKVLLAITVEGGCGGLSGGGGRDHFREKKGDHLLGLGSFYVRHGKRTPS